MKTSITLVVTLLSMSLWAEGPRVVSLSPAITETICHLGGRENLIGRSSACDYPGDVVSLPVCGDFGIPLVERIVALKPDYIMTNTLVSPQCRPIFEKCGIRVLVMKCDTVDDYLDSVERIGRILSLENSADRETARVRERMSSLSSAPETGKSVLWVLSAPPIVTAGEGSFLDTISKLIGVRNVGAIRKNHYYRISTEYVALHQPDYMLCATPWRPEFRDTFWRSIRAVADGHIINIENESAIMRPGPRMFDGIDALKEKMK